MSTLAVRCATDADAHAWDAFVERRSPLPTLHRYAWREIFVRSYDVASHFFVAEDEAGVLHGICPAYVTRAIGARPALYGLRSGLIADDPSVGETLLTGIERWGGEHGIGSMLLSSESELRGPGRSVTKTTLLLDLTASEETMWAALRNKTRNMVRKAQREGIVVESSTQSLDDFYRLYKARMIEKGVPVHHRAFFEQVLGNLGSEASVLVARHQGAAIGALFLFCGARIGYYPYQATSAEGQRLAATPLLIWEAMRACAARGLARLDMGESSQGSSVFQAKINFGGRPAPVHDRRVEPSGSHPIGFRQRAAAKLLATAYRVGPAFVRDRVGPMMKTRGRLL